MVLYVTSGMLRLSLEKVSKELMPFLLGEVAVLILITYVPSISMTIPKWLGYS
jgi:TRAP-type C4-dicarboxylate transport system permease large subunit